MEFTLERYGRFWAVKENSKLLCLTVYKKGARAVIDRLMKRARKEERPSRESRK